MSLRCKSPERSLLELVDAERSARRWEAKRFLSTYSSLKRVRHCGRVMMAVDQGVEVGTVDGRWSVRGVQRCASIHACPVCAPKIRHGRADEISAAAQAWIDQGGQLLFATFTLPHDQGDRLRPLWDAVASSWTSLLTSRAWRAWKASLGVVGYVRALETTVGPNGWHPHGHVLLFVKRQPVDYELLRFRNELHAVWSRAVVRHGYRPPSIERGVRVDPATGLGALASYLAKAVDEKSTAPRRIDLELARPDLKGARTSEHRSPWQVLDEALRWGDRSDLGLWWEYEAATRGRRAITWSVGLRKMLDVAVTTDEELAEEKVGFVPWLVVDGGAWRQVYDSGSVPLLGAAVEARDQAAVIDVLDACGVDLRSVWWRPPD